MCVCGLHAPSSGFKTHDNPSAPSIWGILYGQDLCAPPSFSLIMLSCFLLSDQDGRLFSSRCSCDKPLHVSYQCLPGNDTCGRPGDIPLVINVTCLWNTLNVHSKVEMKAKVDTS